MNGREGQEDKTRALRGRVHAVELCEPRKPLRLRALRMWNPSMKRRSCC